MNEDQLDDDTDIGMESETQGDEEDSDDDPSTSPALSAASTPPYTTDEGFFPPPIKCLSTGKPLSIRRKRGRPKKEVDNKKPLGIKLKRWKSGVYVKGDAAMCKQPRTPNSAPDTPQSQKSPSESPFHGSSSVLDNDCKDLTVNLGEKVEKIEKAEKPFPMLAPDDPPYFPETWPGKICALCNLSERSQLGQREMIRLSCPEGYTPRKANPSPGQSPLSTQCGGDKSPRAQAPLQVSHRRQKSREGKGGGEVLDELSVVGYVEEPDVNLIFEPTGTFYVHLSCILWSDGVSKNESELQMENYGPIIVQALSRRCTYCCRFGASIICSFTQNQTNCGLYFHYPCSLASGGFMESKTKTLICNLHLDQVPLLPVGESSQCSTCLSLGNVSNILMCTNCGSHHHGSCVGLALLPGVRAGWQCFECRVCQVCRQPSEIGKIMLCESCDKAYHPACLRPIVTSIPKYGWKCKCCRVCSDCGSRTPGSGLSSRWHNHFSVCDSCYQQRNKGYCCPICGRAYRAAAHRDMVQCTKCRKYVHGTCDNDADLTVYTNKKEANPDYEYSCSVCKNLVASGRQMIKRKDSFDEVMLEGSLSASQESLYGDDSSGMDVDHSPSESKIYDDYPKSIGLGKGKPFCSSNLAKKRFMSRPKGQQSGGKINYQKMKKMAEFGKKRVNKTKMRGVFGVPGLGLQRPQADPANKNEEEPGVENRMVLCSASDKFVLSQDICVMCGALGTDQEGCLIACAQCGQCYHPYCVNVKVTKVILQKGWRCLDCTVCEGCGQRNDDSRLTLCDDCDISYHIYCMDPPLDYVPRGVWKCKWCVVCIKCGSNDPGFNCSWMNGYTECGPCASHTCCPSCLDPYTEGELVIQCETCERWLHGSCDGIRNEADAEKCADERYQCVLCRPRDVPPPHLLPPPPPPKPVPKPPTPTKSPELPRFSTTQFLVDGVCLSEAGMLQIKSLSMEQQVTQRKKRTAKRVPSLLPNPQMPVQDKEARFAATIESVVSGTEGSPVPGTSFKEEDDSMKDDVLKEQAELWKEGMEVAPREDGKPPEPPEGFTIVTTETGALVLRKKRTRNLQKLGIGGFLVRFRSNRVQPNDEDDTPPGEKPPSIQSMDKPKRKPVRRKPRNKLVESFPSYLQEAFFGRELLDTPKEKELHSSSEDESSSKFKVSDDKTIELSKDELKIMEDVKARQEKEKEEREKQKAEEKNKIKEKSPVKTEEDEGSDSEVLKDLNLKDLPLPNDLLDTDLVNTIMAEGDDIKPTENLDASELNESLETSGANQSKDELTDILSSMSGLPNMDTKDLEEIFKGVESQESQPGFSGGFQLNVPPSLPTQNILPNNFPPPSPYHSEYSNSPHSQVSEPPSPWLDESPAAVDQAQPNGNQSFSTSKNGAQKMEADEPLGLNATISSVLYANTNHPEWKKQYPVWSERQKQIMKKWRSLSNEQKAPFLQKARDNRSVLRMKKAQQDQEKAMQQQKATRESEQERHWKHLQALRQAQAQQQQQVIHEQRAQSMARINRQMSAGEEQNPNLTIQLQVSTNQDPNTMGPLASPSPGSRSQFPQNSSVKVTRIHPSQSPSPFSHPLPPPSPLLNRPMRAQTPNYQPRQFSPNQTSPLPDFAGTPSPSSEADPYNTAPRTFANQSPRMVFSPQSPRPPQAPPRPTLMFTDATRRTEENYQVSQPGQSPEVTRQLRDLLQRQKEGAVGLNQQQVQVQQRQWQAGPVPDQFSEGQEATFRHPLPPGNMSRPRMPVQQVVVRAPIRQIVDPRMQGVQDQRMRLLIPQQRPQGVQPQFITQQNQQQRNPMDSYDEIVHQRQHESGVLQQRLVPVRMRANPAAQNQNVIAPGSQPAPAAEQQEIPESVTAELEQLEQEGGQMSEVEAVSAILGDLADDDDELLAEMGADFNILEYVDTDTSHGDKTNILDIELEDDETKEKKLKEGSSAGQGRSDKTLPPQTPGQTAKQTPQPPSGTHMATQQTPKPPEIAQNHPGTEMPIPQMSSNDLRTEGLEPRFNPSLPRGPVSVPVPVSVDPQRLPMRVGAPTSTRVIVGPTGQIIQSLPVQTRLGGIAVAPPPPPPYPGPPPPYPGQQEQPLLLEDLLEQEKREQEKQQLHVPDGATGTLVGDINVDHLGEVAPNLPNTGMIPPNNVMNPNVRPQFQRPPGPFMQAPQRTVPEAPPTPRVPPFNAPVLQPPPIPPDVIATDQDRQAAIEYETWLNHQNQILQQQLKYYDTEVQKLRKIRKSLNSKQRQLRKNGNELSEQDALELQRISAEQSGLQKHLDASRKSVKQHGLLIQEYKNKQQKQMQNSPMHAHTSPLNQPNQSPLHSSQSGNISTSQSPMHLGGQTTSPMHVTSNYTTSSHPNTPQSPMMSPSPSPLHSPGPVVSQSPGGGMLQSPMSPHSMQQSPRLGTPHSQSEESPFSPGSLPSPGPNRLTSPQTPTPGNPRLPSPQHRARLVTSPGLPDQMNRLHGMNIGPRYARAPMGPDTRLRGPGPQPSATVYQSPGTARVIYTQKQGSQEQNQQVLHRPALTREQVIQRNMLLQQQQQQQLRNQQQLLHQISQQNPNLTQEQKQKLLLVQQQKMMMQQRQLIDQQMIQQQQQLAAHNQRIIQNQNTFQNVPNSSPQRIVAVQNNLNMHGMSQPSQNSPRSPIVAGQNPKSPISPMIQMPQSPMNLPPKSPVAASPVQKSQMIQPQSSPLVQSPLNLPPRSPSLGSPLNKHAGFMQFGNSDGLLPHNIMQGDDKPDNQEMEHGGGSGNAPIPYLENVLRFCGRKLGLRGGSPMWSFSKGKRPKRSDEERSRTPNQAEIATVMKSPTQEKPLQGILKNTGISRVVRPTNVVHPEPSTSNVPGDGNRRISVLRHRKETGIELQQPNIVVQLQSSQQLQLQPNQQKVIIQQMPTGSVQQKNFPLQKNIHLMQGQKIIQKKMANQPQLVSKTTSLVSFDYDSLDDEETPPASPSLRADKTGEQKVEKLDKAEEEEEEIRIATDAEGLELLAQENLLNLELEESDEGSGRRVIIIENSEEGTSGSEKYEDNPNGSPTVMEFMDDDLMVYEPIEGVISDSDELVVLEECEVLEAHEIDISNCEVMEFESVDESETHENEETSIPSKPIEELRPEEPKSVDKDAIEVKEPIEEQKPEQQKQQIIVRHTRKGKQIVMVKRQEGKDQRHVVYRSEKDNKELEDVSSTLSRSSSEEEKSADGSEVKEDVEILPKEPTEADFKKLIEQSEIILMDDNGQIQNSNPTKMVTDIPKNTALIDIEKVLDEKNVEKETSSSEKFTDSPLSPEPLRDKVLSPIKVVMNKEHMEPNLPDPRLLKSGDRNVKVGVTSESKPEDLSQKVLKKSDVVDAGNISDISLSNLSFPDFPEGLASKFFSETSSEKQIDGNILNIEEKTFPSSVNQEKDNRKDTELDQTSVIRGPKTYEKLKFGKSKVQLTEHDYTHIPGKVENFKKNDSIEEKGKADDITVEPGNEKSQEVIYPIATLNDQIPFKMEDLAAKKVFEETPKPEVGKSYPILALSSPRKSGEDLGSFSGSVTTPGSRSTNFDISVTQTSTSVPSEISSHIAKIDPKVRDIISISKITTLSPDSKMSFKNNTTTCPSQLTAVTTTNVMSTPRMSVPVLAPIGTTKAVEMVSKPKIKLAEEAKRSDTRRKSLDNIGRRKSVEERRRSSEATSRENKRELEQRKQMILEEIKQSQLEKEKLRLGSSKPVETPQMEPKNEIVKTEHDLSDVIDILENIDSTPTRLLNASELQSFEKTQLFENEELEKTPPKTKPSEVQKFDEKINLQSLLSDTGKSDIQVSDLARGLSKSTTQAETRSVPPANMNTQSKLAALLTGGSDAMRNKIHKDIIFPTSNSASVFDVRKENVPTLESLLEKEIEPAKKTDGGEKSRLEAKGEKQVGEIKTDKLPLDISPTQKNEHLNLTPTSSTGNLILSPTSGIFRSSGSNLGVPASKILSPSSGIILQGTETGSESVKINETDVHSGQIEQKSSEPQRQAQGILLSSGQSIIQQNTIVSSSPITGNQQGIIISSQSLISTGNNSPGVLMTTARLLQPVPKTSSPTRTSPLSSLPPGVRQQLMTTNYIQQNRAANPVLVRRISTPSPPRVRTPPQTQAHITSQSSVISHPTGVPIDAQNAQNSLQRAFRTVTTTIVTATTTAGNAGFPQVGVKLPGGDVTSRIVVTSGNQLIATTQLQRLSVSQGLSIPTAVMSATINPSSVSGMESNFQRDAQGRIINQQQRIPPQQDIISSQAIKKEPGEVPDEKFNQFASSQPFGNKFPRTDESQNVLLKQLLQNTACAGSTSSSSPMTPQSTSSALPVVPSLEAQLARPVPPTPSSLIPTLLTEQKPTPSSPVLPSKPIRHVVPGKEVPRPAPIGIEARRISQSNRTPSREDLLSPTNSTRSSFGLRTPSPITSPQAGPSGIKQEKIEIKKELPDEVRPEQQGSIGEPPSLGDAIPERISQQAAMEAKKLKRRQYQQKRRQSQGKEGMVGGTPKKRARKGSRMEEDYESYTENLMTQLRQLPPLTILEPILGRNYNVCNAFGSGDHGKINNTEIKGAYGNAAIFNVGDYYNTIPFGDKEKPPPPSPVSTPRGFYDQEFSVIQLNTDSEEKRLEQLLLGNRERDTDTPDTVVSSSSPECVLYDPPLRYPALQLIKEDPLSDEEISRASPVIPIIAPIPIRLKPGQTLKDFRDADKENTYTGTGLKKTSIPIKDGNVTVTLTLNSDAAQDILGVLKDLANILHIPAPTTYQIVERTATPPSIKLGLYRNKGKDGKEGAPVDIQSILNGQAKFCRHCDVVILSNMIRKKVSELPFLSEREDITDNTEDLYFCSSSCYMQFSLMHKSPNTGLDKAATVVDHLSQSAPKKPRLSNDEKENLKNKIKDIKKESESKKPNKGHKYKYWAPGALQANTRYKRQTERELMEMLFRVGVTLTPSQNSDDSRRCLFCHQIGDGVADGPARLLNFDVDKWVHLNCALWSDDVYETVNGALMNVDNALQLGQTTICSQCNQDGATIHCFKLRCLNVYHLGCAVKDECVFFKNKTTYCPAHVPKNEKDNELTTLSVYRRVYVQRDENRQVATVMHHTDQNHLLRVGSLIFLNVGQLLPHQLPVFHTPNYIYPVGYKIIRFYWSMRRPNKRCKYICSIHDACGRPEFRILVQEPSYDDIELIDSSPKAVWNRILEPLQQLRKDNANVQIFPRYVSGEDLFGLNEPAVVRVLESLPGVETLTDYKFKYGRNPLLELPLAVNPTGCARSEPRLKNLVPYKRPHTQRTAATSRPNLFSPTLPGLSNEALCPYSKQFVHSKSSQYKKMKLEWRNNVYLARSKIQGLGLYAARDLERHTMVIEYIGEIIRHELSESREKQYEARNRGVYMFRLDEERVIDATISGGLARYINHSCNPNCVAEIVEVDRDLRIIIFAKRRISRGEELAYDYKFDIEDDQHKIPCLCGAPNCKKWMN